MFVCLLCFRTFLLRRNGVDSNTVLVLAQEYSEVSGIFN